MVVVVLALAVGFAPANATAASDAASTHAYLTAGSRALQAAIASTPVIDGNVVRLNGRYAAECPHVAAGSLQDEAADPMTYEVAVALWSTGYRTDAAIVHAFAQAVKPLRWSNSAITTCWLAWSTSDCCPCCAPIANSGCWI